MHLSEQFVAVIIVFFLVGGYALDALASCLNLKNLARKVPREFSDIFDDTAYAKSQDYLRTNTWFGLVQGGVDLFLLLVFWFCHGFAVLDTWIRGLGLHSIGSGLVFIGSLGGIKLLLSLPFDLYATFVIEERFGFNKTRPLMFIMDRIKSLALFLVFGTPLLTLVLWFFETSGPLAWLLCWGAATLFILAVQYIVPTWIMPLFNRFTPLEDGPLKEAIMGYARSIDFSLTQIFIMDGSRRSTKANAFFTGFGKNRRIVLFDTLVKQHTVDELVSVLAHEMGHFKRKHILKRMGLSILQTGGIFYLVSLCISQEVLFRAFFVEQMSIYAGLVFFGILFAPMDMLISIFMQHAARRDEYEADRFAAQTLPGGAPLIRALKKLSAHNLSNLTPHPFYVFLNYSHPPVLERIRALTPGAEETP